MANIVSVTNKNGRQIIELNVSYVVLGALGCKLDPYWNIVVLDLLGFHPLTALCACVAVMDQDAS